MRKLLIAASLLCAGLFTANPYRAWASELPRACNLPRSRAVREPTWTPIRISRRTRLPHTTIHMFGRLKRRSLFFLPLIPAAVAQGPWSIIYTKAKREISHVRNMVRLLLRWIAETESTSKNGITERLHRRVEGRT